MTKSIKFIDSTSIKVFHNLNIHDIKRYQFLLASGKGLWGISGLMVYLVVNHKSSFGAITIKYSKMHDTKPQSATVVNSMDQHWTDERDISKALASDLLERGVKQDLCWLVLEKYLCDTC
jgi:hypothetical protein